MKAFIRTDSSNLIGSGHVMRCLTLAQSLTTKGIHVQFICRKHPGNINQLIQHQGFDVLELAEAHKHADLKGYETWLGCSEAEDAQECVEFIRQQGSKADLLIVDHYGLGQTFTQQLKPYFRHRMVIDDLANRKQECETLLNQNLLPDQDKGYQEQVNSECKLLLGPQYVLLREEFYQQQRASNPNRLLIFFGGSDPWHLTLKSVQALQQLELSGNHCPPADIVIGQNNTDEQELIAATQCLADATLHIQTQHMAQLMSKAKLMLGAGGSTHWERCIMGLPGLIITVADNQRPTTDSLARKDACIWLGDAHQMTVSQITDALRKVLNDTTLLEKISQNALQLVPSDCGTSAVVQHLMYQLKKQPA